MSYAMEYPWLTFFLGLALVYAVTAIASILCDVWLKTMNRILRHWNIRKHGYPPPHCDADGDFRPMKRDDPRD